MCACTRWRVVAKLFQRSKVKCLRSSFPQIHPPKSILLLCNSPVSSLWAIIKNRPVTCQKEEAHLAGRWPGVPESTNTQHPYPAFLALGCLPLSLPLLGRWRRSASDRSQLIYDYSNTRSGSSPLAAISPAAPSSLTSSSSSTPATVLRTSFCFSSFFPYLPFSAFCFFSLHHFFHSLFFKLYFAFV